MGAEQSTPAPPQYQPSFLELHVKAQRPQLSPMPARSEKSWQGRSAMGPDALMFNAAKKATRAAGTPTRDGRAPWKGQSNVGPDAMMLKWPTQVKSGGHASAAQTTAWLPPFASWMPGWGSPGGAGGHEEDMTSNETSSLNSDIEPSHASVDATLLGAAGGSDAVEEESETPEAEAMRATAMLAAAAAAAVAAEAAAAAASLAADTAARSKAQAEAAAVAASAASSAEKVYASSYEAAAAAVARGDASQEEVASAAAAAASAAAAVVAADVAHENAAAEAAEEARARAEAVAEAKAKAKTAEDAAQTMAAKAGLPPLRNTSLDGLLSDRRGAPSASPVGSRSGSPSRERPPTLEELKARRPSPRPLRLPASATGGNHSGRNTSGHSSSSGSSDGSQRKWGFKPPSPKFSNWAFWNSASASSGSSSSSSGTAPHDDSLAARRGVGAAASAADVYAASGKRPSPRIHGGSHSFEAARAVAQNFFSEERVGSVKALSGKWQQAPAAAPAVAPPPSGGAERKQEPTRFPWVAQPANFPWMKGAREVPKHMGRHDRVTATLHGNFEVVKSGGPAVYQGIDEELAQYDA